MSSYAKLVLYHLRHAPYVVNRMNPLPFLSCHYSKNFWAEVIKWLDDHEVKIKNHLEKECKDEILLVFSVTPFKIDQNNYQNRSIDKV